MAPRQQPDSDPAVKFIGLTGAWKQLAQFGMAGVVAFAMLFLIYAQSQTMKENALQHREDTLTNRAENRAAVDVLRAEHRANTAAILQNASEERQTFTRATADMKQSIDGMRSTINDLTKEMGQLNTFLRRAAIGGKNKPMESVGPERPEKEHRP